MRRDGDKGAVNIVDDPQIVPDWPTQPVIIPE